MTARPTAALLRQADRLGLPRNAPERRDCRALSLWCAAQPRAQPGDDVPWSLERIAAEIKRMEQEG